MDRNLKEAINIGSCKEIAVATAQTVEKQNEKLIQMNKKLEMTLEIVLDHFKELDERIEEIEDKLN